MTNISNINGQVYNSKTEQYFPCIISIEKQENGFFNARLDMPAAGSDNIFKYGLSTKTVKGAINGLRDIMNMRRFYFTISLKDVVNLQDAWVKARLVKLVEAGYLRYTETDSITLHTEPVQDFIYQVAYVTGMIEPDNCGDEFKDWQVRLKSTNELSKLILKGKITPENIAYIAFKEWQEMNESIWYDDGVAHYGNPFGEHNKDLQQRKAATVEYYKNVKEYIYTVVASITDKETGSHYITTITYIWNKAIQSLKGDNMVMNTESKVLEFAA